MWLLHRVYLRELATNALLTFVVLFAMVLLSVLHRGLDAAAGLGLLLALQATLWFAVDTVPHVIALALLFATVSTFGRIARDRELTALTASGVAARSVLAPVLVVGLAFSIASSVAFHSVVPIAHREKYGAGRLQAVREFLLQTGLRGDRFRLGDRMTMVWERRLDLGRFEDVTIQLNDPRTTDRLPGVYVPAELGVGVLRAATGRFVFNPRSDRLALRLTDVRRPGVPLDVLASSEISVSLTAVASMTSRRENERDRTSLELLSDLLGGRVEHPVTVLYVVYRRTCFALLPLLFAPIGLCLGVLARARGVAVSWAAALGPIVVFYGADLVARSIVKATDQAAWAFLPALVVTAFSVPLGLRVFRQ